MNILSRAVVQLPTEICGLVLGIASLSWCWEYTALFGGNAQLFGAIVASGMLLAIAFKFILTPVLLTQQLKHPVIGSSLPTFTMALMIVSNSIGQVNLMLGDAIWLLALVFHILLLIVFVYHRIKNFALHQMLPSWFVPPVGIIVAVVSFSGSQSLVPIAQGVLIFGLSAYSVLLPLMIYRLIFCDKISDDAKPTIAILGAPASLCLAGYLSVTAQPSPIVVAVLAGIALLMTLVTYFSFVHLLRLPFSPGYAAFTFPLAIGATALFKTAHWMEANGVDHYYVVQVMNFAYLEIVVATLMVSYVGYRYVSVLALRPLVLKLALR